MVFNIWYLSIIKTIITHTIEYYQKYISNTINHAHLFKSDKKLILWHDLLKFLI